MCMNNIKSNLKITNPCVGYNNTQGFVIFRLLFILFIHIVENPIFFVFCLIFLLTSLINYDFIYFYDFL